MVYPNSFYRIEILKGIAWVAIARTYSQFVFVFIFLFYILFFSFYHFTLWLINFFYSKAFELLISALQKYYSPFYLTRPVFALANLVFQIFPIS